MGAGGGGAVVFTLTINSAAALTALTDIITGLKDVETAVNSLSTSLAGLSAFDAALSAAAATLATFDASASTLQTTFDTVQVSADAAATALSGVAASATTAGTAARGAGNNAWQSGMQLLIFVQIGAQVGAAFLNMGIQAQDSMTIINSLTAAGGAQFPKFQAAAEQMALKFGYDMKTTGDALYFVISGVQKTSDALPIMAQAMMLAKAGGADLKTVSDALVSSLNAYGVGAGSAAHFSDVMAVAVTSGKMTFQQLASAIGISATTAAASGISFDEVSAALASLTQEFHSTQRASQDLSFLLRATSLNADTVSSAASKLGLTFDSAGYAAMDTGKKLIYLANISKGNEKDFLAMTGGAKGLQDAMSGLDLNVDHLDARAEAMGFAFDRAKFQSADLAGKMMYLTTVTGGNVADFEKLVGGSKALFKAFEDNVVGGTDASIAAQQLGLKFDMTAYKSDNLLQRLQYLWQISNGNKTAFEKLVGGANGLQAALDLMANKGGAFNDILAKMKDSSGATQKAFEASETSISARMSHLTAGLSVLAYNIVIAATPVLTVMLDGLSKVMDFLAQHMNIAIPIIALLAGLLGSALVFAVIALGATLLGGLQVFGVAIAIIGGLSAVVALVVTNWGSLTAAFNAALPILQGLAIIIGTIVGLWGAYQLGGLVVAGITALDSTAFAGLVGSVVKAAVAFVANLIPSIGAFLATLPALIAQVIAATPAFLAGLIPALWGAATAAWGAAAGFLALYGPFLLIGLLIVGAVAGLVLLYQHFQPFTNLVNGLGTVLAKAGQIIMSMLKPAFDAIMHSLQQLAPVWNQLMNALKPLMPILMMLGATIAVTLVVALGLLVAIITAVAGALGPLIAGIVGLITGVVKVITGIFQLIGGIVKMFMGLIKGLATGNWSDFQAGWEMFKQGLINIFTGLWQMITSIVTGAIGAVIGLFSGFIQGIIGFFTNLYHQVVGGSIIPDMVTGIITWITTLVTRVPAMIGAFVASIINWFVTMLSRGVAMISSFVAGVVSGLLALGGRGLAVIIQFVGGVIANFVQLEGRGIAIIISWVGQIIGNIINLASGFISHVTGIKQQVIQHFGEMVTQVFNNIATWVQNMTKKFADLVTGAVNNVQQLPGKIGSIMQSLANQALQWGADVIKMMAQGIINGIGGLVQAVTNAAAAVKAHLGFSVPETGPLHDADQWMPHFGELLATGMTAQVAKLKGASLNVAESMAGPLSLPGQLPQGATASPLATAIAQLSKSLSGSGQTSTGAAPYTPQYGTVVQQFGAVSFNGVQNLNQLYQALNQLAGYAQEAGTRGANSGIGV